MAEVVSAALALVAGWALALHPASVERPVLDRAFPVVGKVDFGSAHHDYPATDIFAGCGSPAVAPVSGTVLEVGRADHWDPRTDRGADRGGLFVSIEGRDGVRYYGSHLSRVAPGLRPGDRVRVGERIGRVGHTGSARYTPCHLHFALSPVCRGTGQWWIRRGVVSPYRYLRRWAAGGHLSPRAEVMAWQRRHGCPARP